MSPDNPPNPFSMAVEAAAQAIYDERRSPYMKMPWGMLDELSKHCYRTEALAAISEVWSWMSDNNWDAAHRLGEALRIYKLS